MTCNIRLARPSTEPGDPDHWADREPVLARFLQLEQPTVLGVQEALSAQLPAIARALPHHRMLGYGRDGGSGGEYSAIFYDERRLDVVAWDQFWLSDLPEAHRLALVGLQHHPHRDVGALPRPSQRRRVRAPQHAPRPRVGLARVKSADLITERLQEVASGAPVVVTGDFNAPAEESAAYDILTRDAGLADTWTTAAHHATPGIGTFTAYGAPVPEGERIDWILAGDGVEVVDSAINPYTYEGRSPPTTPPCRRWSGSRRPPDPHAPGPAA
ncbi:endonuclease/exonuclease/phosphatase family protein [Clavibacter tessellarius]|uniref:endonuclease/exonuclease/phosphatase family protein n=1 Tax=Clavibacter tessellarius TaxID=31965 RepID=UPI0032569436